MEGVVTERNNCVNGTEILCTLSGLSIALDPPCITSSPLKWCYTESIIVMIFLSTLILFEMNQYQRSVLSTAKSILFHLRYCLQEYGVPQEVMSKLSS